MLNYHVPRRLMVFAPLLAALGIICFITFSNEDYRPNIRLPSLLPSNYEHPHEPAKLEEVEQQHGLTQDDINTDVVRIRVLKALLHERFKVDQWRAARKNNQDTLERLASCIASNTCGPGEKTIILLAASNFGNSLYGGTSGEDIWAASTIRAFQSLNHTLLYSYAVMDTFFIYQSLPEMIKIVIWGDQHLKRCSTRNNTNYLESEYADQFATGEWQVGEKGCIKKKGFEHGIPIWKSFVWHFWPGNAHPLHARWTLSPEDYGRHEGKVSPNFYLGYSVEAVCKQHGYHPEREHYSMILAKNTNYFTKNKNFAWPGMLEGIANTIPPSESGEKFRFLSTAGDGPGKEPFEPGVESLGGLKQSEWFERLGRSKLLLGIGSPSISPSPYDALCMGVPFMNVILNWDIDNPEDRTKWGTQHDGLKHLEPPYVYHAYKNDQESLHKNVLQAMTTPPIPSFILPEMTIDSTLERHMTLLNTNWKAQAAEAIATYDPDDKYGFIV